MREKVGKSRNTVFFQWFVAPEGRKVGSLKRRVRSQLAKGEMKNCTPLWRAKHISKSKCTKHLSSGPLLEVEMLKKCTPFWREAHFQVNMLKTLGVRTTFGTWDVEKMHAVVARSTCRSQNVQNTPLSDHFWKLRCRKSARRCGAKHMSKSKCTKHTILGPLLEVEMSKKCTPLWREAHFEVTMYKTLGCSDHFSRFRCRFASLRVTTLHHTLHYITLHSTTLHYSTLHYTPQHYNYRTTQLHSTTLHYTTLHYTTLNSTTLHYTTLHYLPLDFTTLHPTTLHYNYNYDYTTTLHYTPLHIITLHYTTVHYTPLHYTTLHYTEWHCTTDRQVDR